MNTRKHLLLLLAATVCLLATSGCGTRSYSQNGVQVQEQRSMSDYIPFF